MRLTSVFNPLCFAWTVMASPLAEAEKPCGVVTKNTTLSADCVGTLTIAANNITVNLNGYTIIGGNSDEYLPAVQIVGRRGVTLKNGTILASGNGGAGVLIDRGQSNTLSDLSIKANPYDDDGGSTLSVGGDRNTLNRLTIYLARESDGVYLAGSRNTLSDSFIVDRGRPATVLFVSGSRNNIVRNRIEATSEPPAQSPNPTLGAVALKGEGHRFEQNSVTGSSFGDFGGPAVNVLPNTKNVIVRRNAIGNPDQTALKVSGTRHTIEENGFGTSSNSIGLHLAAAVHSTIRKNTFTDNQVGLFVDGGRGNKLSFNRFQPDNYTAIDVKSTGNTVSENQIDNSTSGSFGIVVDGLKNSITSNVISGGWNGTDMTDVTPGCRTNKWRKNSFTTDSEGDGPTGGCIR